MISFLLGICLLRACKRTEIYLCFCSGRYLYRLVVGKVSAYIISSTIDFIKKGAFMKLLDDLYFYLWDKFLRFSLWICRWIDDIAGSEIPNGEENGNGGKENE